MKPTVTAMSSYFGSNRTLSPRVGKELEGCDFVAIPFGGSIPETGYITARTINVNDANRAMMNLAAVAGHPKLGPQMYRQLRRMIFHPDTLASAQRLCLDREWDKKDAGLFGASAPAIVGTTAMELSLHDLRWAVAYFICSFMGRGGNMGTDKEFDGGISVRWEAGGGDSNKRYRSAISSLVAWRRETLWRCNFTSEDFRPFLARVKDKIGHGIYADPPWWEEGKKYKHKFSPKDHADLARILSAYKVARVVIRYGAHPEIERLYPRDRWNYIKQTSRAQSNGDVNEVLIVSKGN